MSMTVGMWTVVDCVQWIEMGHKRKWMGLDSGLSLAEESIRLDR